MHDIPSFILTVKNHRGFQDRPTKKIKLLFIVESPFSERDYERFEIPYFNKNDFSIHIFDLSPVINPILNKKLETSRMKSDDIYISTTKFSAIYFALSNHFDYIIDFSLKGYLYGQPFLLKLFLLAYFSLTSKRIVISTGLMPEAKYLDRNRKNTLFVYLNKIKKKISAKIYCLFDQFYPYAYGFSGTRSQIKKYTRSKQIAVHNTDFNAFLKADKPTRNHSVETILFLDQNHTFATDQYSTPSRNVKLISPQEYSLEVNRTLTHLQSKFNLNVLIQPHPRARLKDIELIYDYPISKLSTAEACKSAKVIVCHDTTAINLAVLCQKPILLLKTPDYYNQNYTTFYENSLNIDLLSKLLDSKIVMSSNIYDLSLEEIPVPNLLKYEQYIKSYITTIPHVESTSFSIIREWIFRDIME